MEIAESQKNIEWKIKQIVLTKENCSVKDVVNEMSVGSESEARLIRIIKEMIARKELVLDRGLFLESEQRRDVIDSLILDRIEDEINKLDMASSNKKSNKNKREKSKEKAEMFRSFLSLAGDRIKEIKNKRGR